jgi:TP901 family phage tail tape measure protein
MPFEEAAITAAKLKEATGVADKEMMQFMDSIARTNQLGVDTTEMRYAWSRSAGQLKLMGIQGLEASKSMNMLFATLIKTGMSGETTGTAMTSMLSAMMDSKKMAKFNAEAAKLGLTFEFVDKKTGAFKGPENMIMELEKMRGLNSTQRFNLTQALLGPGQDAQAMNTIIQNGISGYNEMQRRAAQQATLQQKVNAQLGTLKNLWDAATGTATNTLAAFAEAFSPQLKELTNQFAALSARIGVFVKANPQIAKFIGIATMGFIAVAAILGVAGLAVAGFAKVWSYMLLGGAKFLSFAKFVTNGFMMIGKGLLAVGKFAIANPIVLVIAGIALAAFLIYKYWDKIAPFFTKVWNTVRRVTVSVWNSVLAFFRRVWAGIVNVFTGAWNWIKNAFLNYHPLGMIIKNWTPITQFFTGLWNRVKGIFNSFWGWLKGLGTSFYQAGSNIVNSIWEGIKAMAYKPVQAIKNLAAEIRSYMPFSPAKKGALRDIHRIRLVETIAASMKPNSMLQAMKNTAMATFTAVPKLFQPVTNLVSNFLGTGGSSKSKSVITPTQRASAGASIVYSPTITISGGGASAKEDFKKMLQEHKDELMRLINKEMERSNRKSFA